MTDVSFTSPHSATSPKVVLIGWISVIFGLFFPGMALSFLILYIANL